jgi:hypothetical protein
LQTEHPELQAAKLIAEAEDLKVEWEELILHVTTTERAERERQLRRRLREIADSIGRLLTREYAIEMAMRQRLGRADVEGEEVLPADDQAADQILAGYRLSGVD